MSSAEKTGHLRQMVTLTGSIKVAGSADFVENDEAVQI